jgi:hypothetical protein
MLLIFTTATVSIVNICFCETEKARAVFVRMLYVVKISIVFWWRSHPTEPKAAGVPIKLSIIMLSKCGPPSLAYRRFNAAASIHHVLVVVITHDIKAGDSFFIVASNRLVKVDRIFYWAFRLQIFGMTPVNAGVPDIRSTSESIPPSLRMDLRGRK